MKSEFSIEIADETGWAYSDLSSHNTVRFKGKWGIFDCTNGKLSVPCIFDEIIHAKFSWNKPMPTDSFFTVRKRKKYAVIDHGFYGSYHCFIELGQFKLDCIEGFINGIARVQKKGKMGIINWMGEIIVPIVYDEISEFYTSENPIATIRFGQVVYTVDLRELSNSNPFRTIFEKKRRCNIREADYSDCPSAYDSDYYNEGLDFDQQEPDFWDTL